MQARSVWEISRYCSLSVIKVEGPKNQKWYQYHKYRYLPLQMVPFVTDECESSTDATQRI